MAKYNIIEKKDKVTTLSYRRSVAPSFVEDIARKIIMKLMVEGKYRSLCDTRFHTDEKKAEETAKRLAEDIGVGARQISAVISLRFQQNYSQLVGNMRVHEAKYMLQEKEFVNMTMEDIAINVGFTTRQSFYATFFRQCGMTPRDYKLKHGYTKEDKAAMVKKKAKAAVKRKKNGKR